MTIENDVVLPVVNEVLSIVEVEANKIVEAMPLGEVIEPIVVAVEEVAKESINAKIQTGNTTVSVGIDPLTKAAVAEKAVEGIVNVSKKIGSGIKGLFHK